MSREEMRLIEANTTLMNKNKEILKDVKILIRFILNNYEVVYNKEVKNIIDYYKDKER